MNSLDAQMYAALLRGDFYAFVQRSFAVLNPAIPFSENWHLELLASSLERCRTGACRRLVINVPPRSLKSICASVAFPAWVLGHDPSARLICVSYGQELAAKHALDTRIVMEDAFYKATFPGTRVSAKKQALADFETTAKGGRMATSVGGVLTGRGADYLIIDDPQKPDEVRSDVRRTSVNDWYDHTLLSRLNNQSTGVIIVIMQRLHLDDLVGHVLEQGGWEVLSLPAIAVGDEVHRICTPYGEYTHVRRAGEALHPERNSLETLAGMRASMGEFAFAGQYQQDPVPDGGGLVKEHWFMTYEPDQLPSSGQIIQSWDTASKESELSSFSVCTTWLVHDKRHYLLHVLRRRMDYPTLKREVVRLATEFKASTVLIEDKSSGIQLIQELRGEGLGCVKGIKPEGDKTMRLNAQTATIENGLVFLPTQAPWLMDYVAEMTSFPKAKHSDQVDSTSQALEWVKKALYGPGMGVFYFMKNEAEAEAAKRGR